VQLPGGVEMAAAQAAGLAPGDMVEVVIRQEDIRLTRAVSPQRARTLGGNDGVARIVHDGRIAMRSFVGARVQYVVAVADGLELIVETPTNGPHAGFELGTAVALSVAPAHVYVSGAEA
jgi:iron(III) transport system ATP-binding protein/putative spermidine/putrescine transport system ATP-binding protein/spermidine/putrescine transport system ATP-binding protein